TPNMATNLQTFSLFAALPTELRLEIWALSCTPRVVEVRYSEEQDKCLTSTQPPALLHACRESRHEGFRLYTKFFGTKTQPGSIYFAPSFDVLYIPRGGNMGYGETARDFAQYITETAEHIHSLAIDHVPPEIRRPWETYSKFCLMRNFPYLRETFLVFPSGSEERGIAGQGAQIEFMDPRADQGHILQLTEDVTEAFSYEVG
ncbi:hypothetical protein GQ53DRAFT_609868, partial [Thozetella sp. PMI_491]